MKCPTIDKLSQYVDELLSGKECDEIHTHVESCDECERIVEAFRGEQQFLKETLQTPTLPDDFASNVLEKLEPYRKQKRRPRPWKRVMFTAAGMVLAVGLSAAMNPSFAEWIGGLFTTEQVDEGIRIAADANLVERVNLDVTDNGLTFKVEDVMADSSRVVLSYQVLDKKNRPKGKYLELEPSEILAVDQDGNPLGDIGMSWQPDSDYGLIEISLRDEEAVEQVTVQFNVTGLGHVKGNWKLEVPVEIKENRELTTVVPLHEQTTTAHGVTVDMNEFQFAPSSSELLYETSFTEDELEKIERKIRQLEKKYGKEIVHNFTNYGSAVQYYIENSQKEIIYEHNTFRAGGVYPSDALLRGSGQSLGQLGHFAWNESFVPQKAEDKLTFVLDGVLKTVPADDFSVTFQPKDLKRNPVSFEYEGNLMTIKEAKQQHDYYLRRSIWPIGKRTYFTIKMEGEQKGQASDLGAWALVDSQGDAYLTYMSGSVVDCTLTIYGMDNVPEELTLHLLSVTRYDEVEERWEVPLYNGG